MTIFLYILYLYLLFVEENCEFLLVGGLRVLQGLGPGERVRVGLLVVRSLLLQAPLALLLDEACARWKGVHS